ncbi:DinB family protein [Adhaeribacter pallidiroseus]|uniref:DinB-like domain-containing protein n=1 Tax=Adhaeribacter pallidiroseus TaxID=2072847 RepID=A0A369QIN1_9BACT|nr:DinB family protein [Adhaeribacter pallidiroseus]RDC63127.1 hypothetical protein AHMF7616_01727 [Adhaeribacter pallidiroseus]
MAESSQLEVWLRGPLPDMTAELQPLAHALLQAREEVNELTRSFPEELLWKTPGPVATVGFHLQHLTGVLDRLFTYARGEALQASQLEFLAEESKPNQARLTLAYLQEKFNNQVELALIQLRATDKNQLTATRLVGRAKIPSTMLGLLFHAAEHTQRHVGQLLVTIKIIENQNRK